MLHFCFDFLSPYGYFASLRIEDVARRHGRAVDWHPMRLGVSVLKVMGLKPLPDTPLKGDYVRRDVRRYARKHRVPLGRDLVATGGWQAAACAGKCSMAVAPVWTGTGAMWAGPRKLSRVPAAAPRCP